MSEKKKGLFGKLFSANNNCNCGVKIVEEKPEKEEANKEEHKN